ncbi:DUF4402 domain-containing protein [Pseudoalteromonas distincta]|uniref:DUF4402 domain-containing protein n=1 Tax=Pseudoalteromonas distincta TaxID=77608 RepID=UPI0032E0BAF5
MKKTLTKIALATSIATFSFGALAVENANFDATVTVQNAFTLTNDSDLNFGTIRASADTSGATSASITVSSNPATSATTLNGAASIIAELVAGSPATFSVSGASAFAYLTFDLTNATGNITSVSPAPAGTAFFKVSAPSIRVLTGGNANTNLDLTDLTVTAGQLQVDGSGAATFSMGATLTTSNNTDDSTTLDYIDGEYSGTFEVTLEY